MPSTKIYIAYALAGISTVTGSVNALPAYSHDLDLGATKIVSSDPFRITNERNEYSGMDGSDVISNEMPKSGPTITIRAKTNISKSVPLLEPERYSFQIFEG